MNDHMTEGSLREAPVDYSVIIEWENVRLAASARAREMLRRLSAQMRELKSRGLAGEVILVRDSEELAIGGLARFLDESFPPSEAIAVVRKIEVHGEPYYQKKNTGARAATGAILVFLDSDVIPEERWLDSLLASFERPDVGVVAGSTYIEPTTLYSKAFALFWFFPLRSADEGLVPADTLFGNNIAFRRTLFLTHPFPKIDQFRGQGGMLIRELRELRTGIFLQRGSRCAHPPPNGLKHFARRAICDGHDNIVFSRRTTGRSRPPWRYTYWSVRGWSESALRGVWSRYREVGLTLAGAVAASLIAVGYVAFMLLGEVLTRIDPDIVRRRFSI